MRTITLESVLTCPPCGFAKQETVPTDACQFYYECEGCNALLRPNPGIASPTIGVGSLVGSDCSMIPVGELSERMPVSTRGFESPWGRHPARVPPGRAPGPQFALRFVGAAGVGPTVRFLRVASSRQPGFAPSPAYAPR